MNSRSVPDDKFIAVLFEIKKVRGDAIFTDKKALDNSLRDYLVGEIAYDLFKGKIKAIMDAIDERAYEYLFQHKDKPEKTQKRFVNLLKITYNEEIANFAVNALSTVIGIQSYNLELHSDSDSVEVTKPSQRKAKPITMVKHSDDEDKNRFEKIVDPNNVNIPVKNISVSDLIRRAEKCGMTLEIADSSSEALHRILHDIEEREKILKKRRNKYE